MRTTAEAIELLEAIDRGEVRLRRLAGGSTPPYRVLTGEYAGYILHIFEDGPEGTYDYLDRITRPDGVCVWSVPRWPAITDELFDWMPKNWDKWQVEEP